MGRRTPRGEDTRRRILAAALREFAARGYAAVTIDEIAAAAGVTKGAVYYWFADKDDLGRDLQHELYERLSTRARAGFDGRGDTLTAIRASFDAYLDALGDLGEARFFLRDAWTIPALDEGGRRDHEAAVGRVRAVLESGMRRGEIRRLDPDALARTLMGAWAEATIHVLTTGRRAETREVIDALLESLRAPDRAPIAT